MHFGVFLHLISDWQLKRKLKHFSSNLEGCLIGSFFFLVQVTKIERVVRTRSLIKIKCPKDEYWWILKKDLVVQSVSFGIEAS